MNHWEQKNKEVSKDSAQIEMDNLVEDILNWALYLRTVSELRLFYGTIKAWTTFNVSCT